MDKDINNNTLVVGRKKYFKYNPSEHEGLIVDCDEYEIEMAKSIDVDYYDNQIIYRNKEKGISFPCYGAFSIDWDAPKDGGEIRIKWRSCWGGKMEFSHYDPDDIKGLFDFIGRGYCVFEKIEVTLKGR